MAAKPPDKKTPLYDAHIKAQGKLVSFSGWSMPLHYGSQINEHHQVRQNTGMFDVSHMTITDIIGTQARTFLRYLLANDVAKLDSKSKALYSCLLNESGGIIDDLVVYRLVDDQFRLVSNAATREKVLNWIEAHRGSFDVTVQERQDLAIIAIQGPNAEPKLLSVLPENCHPQTQALKSFELTQCSAMMISRTGYTGEDGFEVMLPNEQVQALWQSLEQAHVQPCGLGARDTLRLEAGLNLYDHDMDETTTPFESNLGWTVAFEPESRDFIGRHILSHQKTRPPRKLIGLILENQGVLRAGQKITSDNGDEGVITSGTFSPTLNCSIGFARLPYKTTGALQVEIRHRQQAVQPVSLPFVRRGQPVYKELNYA